MSKKTKTLWEATEAKTGKQITLWIVTLIIAVTFGNNIFGLINNIINNPTLSALLYIPSLVGIRVVLGYLFDK